MPVGMNYSSSLKSFALLFTELKNLCMLRMQGLSDADLNDKILRDNLFQVASESRRKELKSVTMKRMRALDPYLMKKLVTGDLATGRVIALYALIMTDRLFREFMVEVVADKFAIRDDQLTNTDFDHFFERKRLLSMRVNKWTDYTFYKMRQVMIRILFESGFLKINKSARYLVRPIIDPDVRTYLADIGQPEIIAALVGD
ncbi:DUF1819 family protein [Sporolactobacillus vineae]|uniref:DUF1819 family protein n=2 Tax=Sporolactobacillus vineae TaxID=444463 RepID=UPI0002890EE9|nr:DUF1819 family protein [Sporolactobacillus vineae]